MTDRLTIAVDFDGTIVEDQYPKIGKPKLFAFETLRELQEKGHRLILWTYRNGKTLDDAVAFCKQNGIQFYAVNTASSGSSRRNAYKAANNIRTHQQPSEHHRKQSEAPKNN